MRYVLNGPLKACRNNRRTDKTRAKLTKITLRTQTSIHTNKNKASEQGVIKRIFVLKQLS